MAGGGGGGNSTTVQSIPDELKPLATAYTKKAVGLSNQGFTPYTEQRFEGMNNVQNLGIGEIFNRAVGGSKVMGSAESNLQGLMQGGTNPYLDAMVGKAQASVLGSANQAAAKSGSFGNSGIAEAAAKQMGDVATSMYGNAYESDQGRRLQAIGMAPTFGNQAYNDGAQLLKAGQLLQDQAQQQRDFNYSQFQEGQNLPYKQLAAMSGVFGSGLGSTSTTTQQGGGK